MSHVVPGTDHTIAASIVGSVTVVLSWFVTWVSNMGELQ